MPVGIKCGQPSPKLLSLLIMDIQQQWQVLTIAFLCFCFKQIICSSEKTIIVGVDQQL